MHVHVSDHPHAAEIGSVVATMVDLIRDPNDELHKGGHPTDALDEMLKDLRAVARRLIGSEAWDSINDWADEFLRFVKPRDLSKVDPADGAVRYSRPLTGPTDEGEPLTRDDWQLAAAAVRAYATVVEPDRNAGNYITGQFPYWDLYAAITADLWPDQAEARQIEHMATDIWCALESRYAKRRKPLPTQTTAQVKPADPPLPEPSERKPIMSNTLEALMTVKRYTDAVAAKDRTAALAAIADGKANYANAPLPGGATWDAMAAALDKILPAPAPAPAPTLAEQTAALVADVDAGPVPQATAPEPPAPPAADDLAGPYALTLTHRPEEGTRLLGGPKGKPGKALSAIMGKNGQHWRFQFAAGGAYWYIVGSKGYAAKQDRIDAALAALDASTAPVFTVTVDVSNIDATGAEATPRVLRAEAARSARTYRLAYDRLVFNIHSGKVRCAHCPTMLTMATATIVNNEGEPDAVCLDHATGATPAPAPQAPRQVERKVERKAEPKVEPSAQAPVDLESLSSEALVKLVAAGSVEAMAVAVRRMSAPAPAPRARQAAVKPAPAPVAAPKVAPKVEPKAEWILAVAPGARMRQVAQDMRRELHAGIVRNRQITGGAPVTVQVYAHKPTRTLTIVIAGAPNAATVAKARALSIAQAAVVAI